MLAGAGTGKTRAITHRIAYGVATGVYDPTEVLAVTFTTRAAGEMRGRLRALGAGGVQARTFHSAALRQLRYFWPRVYGHDLPNLTESKIALLAQAARRSGSTPTRRAARPRQRDRVGQGQQRPPRRLRRGSPRGARSVSGLDPETVARVFAAYEDVKRGQGRMDMEDVLLLPRACSPRTSGSPRRSAGSTSGSSSTSSRTSRPLQSALLDLWLGGRDDLCVVGDPAQTIYSFAGADAAYLRDFTTKHPRRHLHRAGPQLPLHPAGRDRRQPAARRARPARAWT